jgi:VCBS repeat-containing protein
VNNDTLVDTDYVLGVTANDGTVDSAEAFATVIFDGVNDAPTATPSTSLGDENTDITVNLTGTDDDGTVDFATVTSLPAAAQGVLFLADGITAVVAGTPITSAQAATLVFTPTADFNGDVTIPFTVTDDDGLESSVANEVVTVNDVNAAAVIAGDDVGAVTEDATDSVLTDTGILTISDADAGEAAFQTTGITSSAGALGSLSITSTGAWTYTVDNADVQYLTLGEEKIEIFTVLSVDGTTHDVLVTITGTYDVDSDGDGVIDIIDIDDDNDGIIDTVEDSFTIDLPFTTTTANSNIVAEGGTGSQNINLSSFGVVVGQTIDISNLFAQGDLNSGGETFTLVFNGVETTGAVNTGSQSFGFSAVTPGINLTVDVIDIGGGIPGISVTGSTTGTVNNFNGFTGVDYRFDIAGVANDASDIDGDGIINSLDLDTDNDGIIDNVEAQEGGSFIATSGIDANNDGLDDAYDPLNDQAGLTPVDTDGSGAPQFVEIDSDADGISDIVDVDDDDDGILDTVEDAVLLTTVGFTTTTADSNIISEGAGTSSQNINLSSFGAVIGQTIDVSNLFAEGDLNSSYETFTLVFNGGVTTGAVNTGSENFGFRVVTPPVDLAVQVIDIGGGVPGITVAGTTSGDVNFFSRFAGVDYRFDITSTAETIVNNDIDGDGIINSLDVDSDNDGILDNIEAQPVNSPIILPSGIDANNDGLDDAYGPDGLTPAVTVNATTLAGLRYEYFEGSFAALPDFDQLTMVAAGVVAGIDLSPRTQNDNFAFRFSGEIQIDTAGSYNFFTASDDGSQLFIDGQLVVDNDGLHSTNEETGPILLSAGRHEIVITYFERTGGENLTVSYEGPGVIKQEVPDSLFFEPNTPDAYNVDSNNDGTLDGKDPATTGNDRLVGNDLTGDSIDGLGGNDQIFGLGGNDILLGNDGDDILFGGAGDDTLTGGNGSDTFIFNSVDGSGSTDTITDFSLAEGDVLDLADLLTLEEGRDLTDFLNVSLVGVDTVITVDADGVGGDTDLTVVLEGADLVALGADQAAILQSLIASNNLIVDQ